MTIQEIYNKHLRGEINNNKFIYLARRDQNLSQFINNLTSYKDTISILKNRGIITETIKKLNTLTLDTANPYELKKGLDKELDLCYKASPAKPISQEEIIKAQNKVLKNLAKDPNYYTKQLAGVKPDGDLSSDVPFGEKTKRKDVLVPLKKENFKDENHSKVVSKNLKSNVKGTLDSNINERTKDIENINIKPVLKTKLPKHSSNKPSIDSGNENAKSKNKKGVSLMSMVPKKQKGIKSMATPGKAKVIKLKESKKLYNLLENIPQTNSEFLPFANVKQGMTAHDDSGETFKVITTGDYNHVKRYDGLKTMSRFLSSDPTGIDGEQLVALIDGNGNTFVRIYGTGGVYVDNSQKQEYHNPQKDIGVEDEGMGNGLNSDDIGFNDEVDEDYNSDYSSSNNKRKAVIVKPNSPEADPNQLKKYTDQGYDIELDPKINEDMNGNFKNNVLNKEVPKDETELAEAKASILVTITKANLNTNVNLDEDIALSGGNIWVRVELGNKAIANEQLKALASDSKFRGLNPISNTELALVFSKK